MAAANADVLVNYREQKKNLEKLATTARKQMQARLTELLAEAASIQSDFKNDFGANPELPASVKTFTLSDGKKKSDALAPATDAMVAGKKIGGLRRSLKAAIRNGETARAGELATQIKELGGTLDLASENESGAPTEVVADPIPQASAGDVADGGNIEEIEPEQLAAAVAGPSEDAQEAWI
jgi:hypothetical protein